MTGLDPLAGADAPVRLALVAPEVRAGRLADAWLERAGGDAVVLATGATPTGDRSRTVAAQASRHLDAAGWTVPAGVVHGGRELGAAADAVDADAWFERFRATHPEHDRFQQTVRSPAALVDTLETMLADAVVPAADGPPAGAPSPVHGDPGALRDRCALLASSVPAVDVEAVVDALGRDDTDTLVHDTLASYLAHALDRGRLTPGLRLALAAGHRVRASDGPVLLLAGGAPAVAAVDLALASAAAPVTVAVDAVPAAGGHPAWPRSTEALVRLLASRAGVDATEVAVVAIEAGDGLVATPVAGEARDSRAALAAPERLSASAWALRAGDPVAATVGALESLLADTDTPPSRAVDDPGDIRVVVPTHAHARRLLRLAAGGSAPVARAGSIAVGRTRIAVLSRAWLRIVEGVGPDRGWAVVLEAAGCSPGDLEAWLAGDERPAGLVPFRGELAALPHGPAVIAAVADRYGADGRATHALLAALDDRPAPPSRGATLDRLIAGVEAGPRVRLEPPSAGRVRVVTRPPTATVPVVVHVDEPVGRSTPALAYRPPLGAQPTRTIATVGGHPVERAAPRWATLGVVRSDADDARRWRATAAGARAGAHVVLVGGPPAIDARPLDLG